MSGIDSHLSFIHRPDRFIDVVDEEWVTHQLPLETLFRNVSEFDDDDDDDAINSTVATHSADAFDQHFSISATGGGSSMTAGGSRNGSIDDHSEAVVPAALRWNDLALAPFLASAPQRPQPPTNSTVD